MEEYPKWVYNKDGKRQLVANAAALAALEGEWGDSPEGPFQAAEKPKAPDPAPETPTARPQGRITRPEAG